MDHNEVAQSVPGLDQTDILEIIDHHRLADIQTNNPIWFRNEPVGSTTTIVAGMFQERGIMPSKKMAGLMASAIVSDTVMFKSPHLHQEGSEYAPADGVPWQGFLWISWDGISLPPPHRRTSRVSELLFGDFKEFHIAGHDFGIGQITCVDSDRQLQRKEEFLKLMEQTKEERSYSLVMLMLTDVLLEGTQDPLYRGRGPGGAGVQCEAQGPRGVPAQGDEPEETGSALLSALWGLMPGTGGRGRPLWKIGTFVVIFYQNSRCMRCG